MLKVYNTLTKKKEEFKPLQPGKVGMYVCGVTPYNYPHIGNARPFVTWDVIKRFFRKSGYEVKHIQNFTDVDDKIIRTANEQDVTWKDIADRYIQGYFEAMDALNVQHADLYPRVSEHMPDILQMIHTLVDKGYAYVIDDGDVYFSVEKFADYGKLSGRKLEDMQAGARIEVDVRKHHPMDFALWKAAKLGEPSWDSPWGKGRPGWHIECSAMSLKYLGKTFDFHGGGSDLIFPHHENEIAQSQACCGDMNSFARYWLHNGFITIHEEKMSKSKNNFFTVQDILQKYPGEVIRLFILQTHYRSPLDFSDERLKEAQTSLGRLRNTWDCIGELQQKQGTADTAQGLADTAASLKLAFYEAMEDDFNTALAVSDMFALSKEINIYYNDVVNNGVIFDADGFAKAAAVYQDMAEIIGVFEAKVEKKDDGLTESLMQLIIGIRQDARQQKNWAVADKIRDGLKDLGIVIEDSPQGARWKKL